MDTTHNWITAPITADLLRGALDLERTERGVLPHRLPAWARAQYFDGQLAMAESQPSGVRLVFRTRATAVELDTLRTKRAYVGAPPRPDGVYDLLVDGRLAGQAAVTGGNTMTIDMTTGSATTEPGPFGTLHFTGLPEGGKDIEIGCRATRPPNSSPCAPTPPSSPHRTRAARCGCTTAVRSATAPAPRAPPPPGPHSPPPSAAWN